MMNTMAVPSVIPLDTDLDADGKVVCECGCGERYFLKECVTHPTGCAFQSPYEILYRPHAADVFGERLIQSLRPATFPLFFFSDRF